MTQAVEAQPALSEVGHARPRLDASEKLLGKAEFTGDVRLPGMLEGKVLRSYLAHARIARLETAAALRMPGVVAVLTADDLRDLADPRYGHLVKDRPVLATGRVLFEGEPVAAVAAETEAQAEAGLAAIEVEYEALPVAADTVAALSPDAPLLHPGERAVGPFYNLELPLPTGSNLCYRYEDVRGEASAALEAADVVVEGEYEFPAVYQYALETHTVVASHDGASISVISACQHPFLVRSELAELFGLPLSSVSVRVPYLGGGFGSKSYTKLEPITVALARKAGRPVRIVNRVEESMQTTRRHAMRCRMRTGATRTGRLVARQATLWMETGAYADNGPTVTFIAGLAAVGPYRWDALEIEALCVYTNRPPAGSYRGFGAAHLQWVGESQVEELARKLGIDAVEFRRRNLLRRGEHVHPARKPLDCDLAGDLERVAEAIGWGEPRPPLRGVGLAVGVIPAGASAASGALVRLDYDGRVSVVVGTGELGQGSRTVMGQIAAEVLSVPLKAVRVEGADTRFTPFDRSTGASRSTTVAGLAVQRAAEQVRQQLLETASQILEASPEDLELAEGRVRAPSGSRSYRELIRARTGSAGSELVGRGEVRPEGEMAGFPLFWEVCVGAAEVQVDPRTGVTEVLRTATVADVGRAINPQLVECQDEGCTLQALGNTLFEEMEFSEDGRLLNGSLLDYRVPTFLDVPGEMTCVIVENADGPGPFGAKGCGEGVFGAIPAALVNALQAAGVRVRKLPMTPERTWRALRDAT